MAMKLVKKTDNYSIYLRGDKRHAVEDAHKQPVNGEEKVRILVEEGLVKAAVPAKPEEPVAEEASAEEATAEEAPVEEEAAPEAAVAEEPAAEEPVAEEPVAEEPAAEEAASEEEDK
jgi:septal ring-binding cell division protein DamX